MDMWRSLPDAKKNGRAPSRRGVLRVGVCGIAAVGAQDPASAGAQTKAAKAAAEYQSAPKNGLSCGVCSLFRPPHACEVVAGDISPQGWCKFFDLPD
jgi:hypothetical protein